MEFTSYTIESIKLEIPNNLLNDRMRTTFETGKYEKLEYRVLGKLIKKGEVILELGGGVGFISAVAARHPNTKSVYVVEADARLIPIIKRTHELNSVKATIFNEMVGQQDGSGKFYIADSYIASSAYSEPGRVEVTVPITSFQRRIDHIRPSMLIVDIEGAEAEIFSTARLKSVRTILVELHPKVIGTNGTMKVFDNLRREGLTYDHELSSRHIVVFKRSFKPRRLPRLTRMIIDSIT